MEKDPLYLKIIERLNGHLDDQLFQSCADILGNIFPGLIPFKGGDDAGMDGAIPSLVNRSYPLIVTTSENLIRNLTKNLEKYKSEGGKERRAVFATSKFVTPRKIRNFKYKSG